MPNDRNLHENFEAFGLSSDLLQGIAEAGFTAPSEVQKAAIPLIIQGRDLVAQARTGTGKTAAFGLGLMNRLKFTGEVEILVITPTRELAAQVSDELFKLGKFAGVKTVAVYGGQSSAQQLDRIQRGAQIVVATPGRLLDHLSSKRMRKFKPTMVVLDEADEMLDMGFIDDIKEIFKYLSEERQTLVFSATMPYVIKQLTKEILRDPTSVDVSSSEMTSTDIEQLYCIVEDGERADAVVRLIDSEAPDKAIVFCRTKRETDDLCTVLVSRGFKARPLHGDMDQTHRQDVIRGFRSGKVDILVATDVAARGLDIAGVTHVFNYHLPFDKENYVHRIGRTGRAGAHGKAITLATPYEFRKLKQIQQAIKASFVPSEVPSLADLGKMHDRKLLELIQSHDVREEALSLLSALEEKMDLTQIAVRLISILQSQRVIHGPDRIGLSVEQVGNLNRPRRGRPESGGRGHPRRRRGAFDDRRRPQAPRGGGQRPTGRRSGR